MFAVFLLIIITIVFSIVRAQLSMRGPREDDVIFFLCACFELTICESAPLRTHLVPLQNHQSLCDRDLEIDLQLIFVLSLIAIIMACVVSYRAWFTAKNRQAAKSTAAIPLRQYQQSNGNDHGHNHSEVFDGHKLSQTGQMDSRAMHRGEWDEALPRDMINVMSDIVIHSNSNDEETRHNVV